MASWRPRASNLEPLGSILEGFGLDFEILECSETGFERPWTYFWLVFGKTCGSHIWGHLLTIVGMPSLPFHFILFLSVPFHFIACHSIPFRSIPFGSIPMPFDRFGPRRDARSVNNTRGFRPQTRVGLTLTSGFSVIELT